MLSPGKNLFALSISETCTHKGEERRANVSIQQNPVSDDLETKLKNQ
jgi:hypothetical protein